MKTAARLEAKAAYFNAHKQGLPTPSKSTLFGPTGEPVSAGVVTVPAGAVAHFPVPLEADQTLVVETRQLSAGADPVLHLLARGDRPVAFDDDSGSEPGAAKLRYTAPESGVYLLVVRAYAAEDDGWCDLVFDEQHVLEGIKFGGSILLVAPQRTLHAVLKNDDAWPDTWPPLSRAATDTILMLLDPQQGELLALDDDSGVELGSQLTTAAQAVWAYLGAYGSDEEGGASLVINDVGLGDTDGDGLGDHLERAISTCPDQQEVTIDGFACRTTATAQDTDGDGLSDRQEVLGVEHEQFPQLLPRWGADPRHKDLWVEIDCADWVEVRGDTELAHTGRSLSSEEAQQAARVFARLTDMRNPDGQEGIRLHLDLGHPCGRLDSGIDRVCGAFCAWSPDGTRQCGQSWASGPPQQRWQNLSPARRHLFHVAVADRLIDGQAPGGPADNLEYDADRFSALVHELGHNLGLSRHYGTPETGGGNCKPNYPSVMNYAYADRFASSQELSFSDGSLRGVGDLDPTDLDETQPWGGEQAEVGWLATRPFYYELHDCQAPGRGCKVDFNRDGQLDPSVRAYLSPMAGYGFVCEGAHGNGIGSENIEGLNGSGGPAAAEMQRRSADGTLRPAVHVLVPSPATTHDGMGLYLNVTEQQSGGWQGWQEVPVPPLRSDTQPAALTWQVAGEERIWFFVCSDDPAPVHYGTIDGEGGLSLVQPVPGQPPGLRARDVSVALGADELVLVVRDASPQGADRVWLTRRTPAGWMGEFSLLEAEQTLLRSQVTPALAAGPLGRFYLVTADPDPPPGTGPPGRLHLYSAALGEPTKLVDEEVEGVRFEDGLPNHHHELWSRPALAFVPHLDGLGQPLSGQRGYLALWWTRGTRTRFLWSWGLLDEQQARFSLGRWHHYEAYGYTDALAGASPALVVRQGTQLTALITQSKLFPSLVRHIPFADGIPAEKLVLRDFDDRPVIRENLCRSLNAACPERCQKLTAPCLEAQTSALTTNSCQLPRWDPVESIGQQLFSERGDE